MAKPFTDAQRRMLAVLCDTFVPPVRPPAPQADDPTGFWGRRATDLGVDAHVADFIARALPDEQQEGLGKLLDVLAYTGFRREPQWVRERTIQGLSRLSPDVRMGFDGFRAMTMFHFYGGTGPGGVNPNWSQLGYPGPPAVDATPAPFFRPVTPPAGIDAWELEADVVVIGSGSGGGVVAAELAQGGRDVVVLEAGGHHEEGDFPTDEASALRDLYWRGGAQTTTDGNVNMLAGATLGGGSTVNWMNCVRPPDHVLDEWASLGLKDVATSAFDGHVDAVLERIAATEERSDLNGPNQRLREGAQALQWHWHVAMRNSAPDNYDPAAAGHVGYGDRFGNKMGTAQTYLRDAAQAGARLVTGCTAERVVVEDGRAAGVEAVWTDHDGRRVAVHLRARQVVVAAGALETPAVLLRSGIGGPAVGRFLRLHPVPNLPGFYDERQDPWWGPPQSCVVDEFARSFSEYGYLVETPHQHPGLSGAALPWRSGRDHKLLMGRGAHTSVFLSVVRERGGGRVTVDGDGAAVVSYPLDDPQDQEVIRHAVRTMVALHEAAGARAIADLTPKRPIWKRGQDAAAYAEAIAAHPLGAGGRVLFSAHQMGTARMGHDPADSVADPEGQLHDTRGVWIGDTSAFPTAAGSNPMVTCMALARRTAHAVLADG